MRRRHAATSTRRPRGPLSAAALLVALTLPSWPAVPTEAEPKERQPSKYYDLFDNSAFRPATRFADPARLVRRIGGRAREAANVDEHDQVRLPSTWWQPRLGFRPVTVGQMLRGPGVGTGPAPGRWTVTKAKTEGVTPGFFIKDRNGDRFIIKFDPPGQPELTSSADVVSCYLFWAAGYNVPDDAITWFRPESLDIAKDAKFTDEHGHKQPMTHAFLEHILDKVARQPDGSFRALSSRFLKGTPLGPFDYRGRRKDDPEDMIPHQLRRELRGLWTLAAWTNHADVRGPNSLDLWVKEGGRSFVRHHLIDFNGCLGAGSIHPKAYMTGNEYFLDYGVAGKSLVTLGFMPFPWEKTTDPHLPSIGFIEASAFDPVGWRPDYPNPAFDERTERDVRWGARIVAGFSDDHIRAAVAQGKYSDPRAADYLTRVLIERRDKIVNHWLSPRQAHSARAER